MKKTIKFTLESPVKCTDEQFEEWVRYHLGLISYGLSDSNQLRIYDLAGNVDNVELDGEDLD